MASDTLLLVLLALTLAGWSLALIALRKWRAASRSRASQSAKYGRLTEQWAPFMERWPLARRDAFRFLGSPIDGVAFEEDAVYLVEVKSAGGQLSPEQRRIRDHVRAGRVGWVRFDVRDDEGEADVERPWVT